MYWGASILRECLFVITNSLTSDNVMFCVLFCYSQPAVEIHSLWFMTVTEEALALSFSCHNNSYNYSLISYDCNKARKSAF